VVRLAQGQRRAPIVIQRAHIVIRGAVQGVGFRPFVYRLATELDLQGWVLNSSEGVFIEVQGARDILEVFLLRLEAEKPARSFIQSLEFAYLDPVEFAGFEIRSSSSGGARNTLVLPDIATCPDCLAEILDPADRRYRYPFTNCTNCGPRFTIIESLPYDRGNTSMKRFALCPECRHEYEDPLDRRFHAQPTACPVCGPRLELWNASGQIQAQGDEALLAAAAAVRAGLIAAVKGLGGFHLVADGRNHEAVERLRARKRREEKPLALMYPSIDAVRKHCDVSRLEERLLLSPESPIVLLRRNSAELRDGQIASSVAPGNPYLGVMLPYTPLHHLLLRELAFPIIATSGNLSDEPICIDEREALQRLKGVADVFLVHDRPIVRHMDDSIVRVMLGRELVLRRARGYAPLPLSLRQPAPAMLAVGGHLKNTIALAVRNNVFISQHIGDLETPEAAEAFHKVIASFYDLYETRPEIVVTDMHPDYLSTRFAQSCSQPLVTVQHHYAHIAACMAENELEDPVLGVSWDGTGYGLDGTIWGGEFLLADKSSFLRIAALRSFRLPGGASAIKEPRRTAIGVLYEIFGDRLFDRCDLRPLQAFSRVEAAVLHQMLNKRVNSPLTTSAGRLFDAVASLSGLRQKVSFEGQAAMELEFAITEEEAGTGYPYALTTRKLAPEDRELIIIDWEPMILALSADLSRGVPIGAVSARFHVSLAEMIVAVARRVGLEKVALSGGCFQNRFLTERTVRRLEAEGFRPYWHQRIPPNDGGIALGQIAAVLRSQQRGE
jgi:hydrogenase maturation protein HypF